MKKSNITLMSTVLVTTGDAMAATKALSNNKNLQITKASIFTVN
ncbi:hypothetical protein [Pediococcus stilesii]|nr:hypothetical protein [Pediococcus stilesii]